MWPNRSSAGGQRPSRVLGVSWRMWSECPIAFAFRNRFLWLVVVTHRAFLLFSSEMLLFSLKFIDFEEITLSEKIIATKIKKNLIFYRLIAASRKWSKKSSKKTRKWSSSTFTRARRMRPRDSAVRSECSRIEWTSRPSVGTTMRSWTNTNRKKVAERYWCARLSGWSDFKRDLEFSCNFTEFISLKIICMHTCHETTRLCRNSITVHTTFLIRKLSHTNEPILSLLLLLDYSYGFGGKYKIQKDRVDKSAVDWNHHEKIEKHESQKGNFRGLISGSKLELLTKELTICSSHPTKHTRLFPMNSRLQDRIRG